MTSLPTTTITPRMKRVRWAPEYRIPPAAPTKKEKEVNHGDPPSPPRRPPYDSEEPPMTPTKVRRVHWDPVYELPPAAPIKKERVERQSPPPSPPRRPPYEPSVTPAPLPDTTPSPIAAPPLDTASPVSTEASIKKKKRKKSVRPSGPLRRSARIAAKNQRNQPLRRSLRLAIKNGETDITFIPTFLPDSRRSKRKVDPTRNATNDNERNNMDLTTENLDDIEEMEWEYTYDGVEDMEWEPTP